MCLYVYVCTCLSVSVCLSMSWDLLGGTWLVRDDPEELEEGELEEGAEARSVAVAAAAGTLVCSITIGVGRGVVHSAGAFVEGGLVVKQ